MLPPLSSAGGHRAAPARPSRHPSSADGAIGCECIAQRVSRPFDRSKWRRYGSGKSSGGVEPGIRRPIPIQRLEAQDSTCSVSPGSAPRTKIGPASGYSARSRSCQVPKRASLFTCRRSLHGLAVHDVAEAHSTPGAARCPICSELVPFRSDARPRRSSRVVVTLMQET